MSVNTSTVFDINKYNTVLNNTDPIKFTSYVTKVTGLTFETDGLSTVLGEICKVVLKNGKVLLAEVVGLEKHKITLISYNEMHGIEVGNLVIATGEPTHPENE